MEFPLPPFPVPPDEAGRLAALDACDLFGTDPEEVFDAIVERAAEMADAPVALVNIIGEDSIWVKAGFGIPPEIPAVPRGAVCCAHAICQAELMWVADTHADPRFRDLPFIATQPFLRFYAGMPIFGRDGHALGTLCIMDQDPRAFDERIAAGLAGLAGEVRDLLALRLGAAEIGEGGARLP